MRHHPGALVFHTGIELPQGGLPGFDVTPLGPSHLPLAWGGQVGQIAILDPDQVRFVEGEVQMEFDEPRQCRGGIGCGRHHCLCAGEQFGAHPDQQFDQKRLFVGKVTVERRPADTCGGADVLESHRQETPLGDQLFGCGEQL